MNPHEFGAIHNCFHNLTVENSNFKQTLAITEYFSHTDTCEYLYICYQDYAECTIPIWVQGKK